MKNTEEELKERIKELTCLYEISSIIGNSTIDEIEITLMSIAKSLKNAFQFPKKVEVNIQIKNYSVGTSKNIITTALLQSSISVFNKPQGMLTVFFPNKDEASFLTEEQDLLDSISIKIGNLFERIEIKESETSLRKQMERADRLVILGELTAGIAHELNSPLANILGFAELLKSDLKNNKTAISDLDKIIQNTIFSREVVKKLMFFACEMPQEMKEVNLVPIIKESINLLDSSFRKKEVRYLIEIEREEIFLKADPIQLTQIIFNLCMNAIYFSPKNGLVTISATESKKFIVIKISDEGQGLNENDLDKVFQPFFTTKPVGDGSGLGLSVVHGIVNSHQGTISVTNNQEKGACFKVTLPKQ